MLSAKLRECRELCDYSQQQVAECLNIDRSTYSYYESGRTEPSLDNLKKLAKLFGVSVCEMLEVSDEPRASLHDQAYDGDTELKLDTRVGVKVGDLSKEEQKLVMRFRMLTQKQRNDVMLAMCVSDADQRRR